MENEVRSCTFILDALSSSFTAHKTHILIHMHAAMHASMTCGCHFVSKFLFMQNCINYCVTSPDGIITLGIQTLSPAPPVG